MQQNGSQVKFFNLSLINGSSSTMLKNVWHRTCLCSRSNIATPHSSNAPLSFVFAGNTGDLVPPGHAAGFIVSWLVMNTPLTTDGALWQKSETELNTNTKQGTPYWFTTSTNVSLFAVTLANVFGQFLFIHHYTNIDLGISHTILCCWFKHCYISCVYTRTLQVIVGVG